MTQYSQIKMAALTVKGYITVSSMPIANKALLYIAWLLTLSKPVNSIDKYDSNLRKCVHFVDSQITFARQRPKMSLTMPYVRHV